MMRVLTAGLFVLLASVAGAQAASFDCNAARAPDEKAVCASMALSDLDVKMATLYEVAGHLVAMGQRGMLQDEQRDFLKTRTACGANAACLSSAYEARIKTINGVLQSIYSRGPF
ncbi:lysozyme inhibitor LprI family protein [Aquabacter cavernae]|uniref:lysozyme inhibitor LprI family protein n=1 Tax=Aquabacter cavernae TaxID=2496029 RepID=UPI000F8CB666|nr:hypothetical protein [Aquabacter cavernae]